MRILIVEDQVKMASLLRRGLREEGLAADVARSGDDAIWMARATEYDAIVLDVMLPAPTASRCAADCGRPGRGHRC